MVAFTFAMRRHLIRLESGPCISFRLAKFGWVAFADLRVQRRPDIEAEHRIHGGCVKNPVLF